MFSYAVSVSSTDVSWEAYPLDILALYGYFSISKLSRYTLPLVGFNKPIAAFIVVDFPAPFGPKNPNTSP